MRRAGVNEFYSLRAKPEVLSVASEVACKITDEFRKAHNDLVQAMILSRMGSDSQSGRQTWSKKWFA